MEVIFMCSYCEEEEDDGYFYNIIKSERFAFGNIADFLSLEIWMKNDVLEATLASYEDEFAVIEVPIKYCPFCGRKLN